jgi:surface protein
MQMFEGCKSLTNIDLSFFKNSKALIYTSGMFKNCYALERINFPINATNSLAKIEEMFYGCKNIIDIDLSNFVTKNVIIMSQMFFGCTSLKSLNIQKFSAKNLKNKNSVIDIFKGIKNLNTFTLICNPELIANISSELQKNWNLIYYKN